MKSYMKESDQKMQAMIADKTIGVTSEGLGYFGKFPHIPQNLRFFVQIELMNTYIHGGSNRLQILYFSPDGVQIVYAYYKANPDWVTDKNGFLESFAYNWANLDQRLTGYVDTVVDDTITLYESLEGDTNGF